MIKKKLLYHSDFSLAKTGFGRAAKTILSYLYKTNKYDIVHYCCGVQKSNPELNRTPWKSIGSLPDEKNEISKILNDPIKSKSASYGDLYLDQVVKEEKPDIYIGVQDIWGLDFAIKSEWFSKINSIIWTTLDSLPILPDAINHAKTIKNYWIWSDFATKELHKLGHKHVKTMHGALDTENFYRLSDEERLNLRKKFEIDQDKFIIGFVFRNQLRKSLPNLFEGYSLWKKENPSLKNTALLLHTSWKEGWNIQKLAQEYGISNEEILTTYICTKCKKYKVHSFCGEKIKCKSCGSSDGLNTISVNLGVTEEQLNEIYNLMDVYCHPFTSGGQEIPIQEAKLAELITLVTNYSCGEEMCEDLIGTIPLEWHEYREHGTEFKKASTDGRSIKNSINIVYNMSGQERSERGAASREWAIKQFSIKKIGPQIEKILDNLPETKFNFESITKINESAREELFFDNKNKKNLLVLDISNDVDMIYSLSIPSKLKKIYPNTDLYVVLNEKYVDMFVPNKSINQLIINNDLYKNDQFLLNLKRKYHINNIFKLKDSSSNENFLFKLNKTNIEIDI